VQGYKATTELKERWRVLCPVGSWAEEKSLLHLRVSLGDQRNHAVRHAVFIHELHSSHMPSS